MNFKNHAKKLEQFLEEELSKNIPLLKINNSCLMYKKLKIKQLSTKNWLLSSIHGVAIHQFKLKASAVVAAKLYDQGKFQKFNEIKHLDSLFWQSFSDAELFEEKIKTTQDFYKKDIFLARYTIAKDRTKQYKQKISSLFKSTFDK